MIESPSVRLIDDLPVNKDAFGPHQRIANAIADLVLKEKGGKAIALEGTWGSGKSTIVELLHSHPINVHVFDAWSHKEDHLRRAFLESLLDKYEAMQTPGTTNVEETRKTWKDRRDQLRKRLKIDNTIIEPTLTIWGVLFGFVLLLMPLGTTLVGLSSGPRLQNSEWLLPVGALMAVAPFALFFIAIVASTIIFLVRKARGKSYNITLGSFAIFLNKTTTKHETKTMSEPEPSTIEFAEHFQVWTSEVLDNEDMPLVIVIDNLDRVPREHALEIWSTMRIFIETCSSTSGKWKEKVWFLVPYDRVAVARLWDSSNPSEDDFTGAFIDKSFQARFQVPPPLLSKWGSYFRSIFKLAFPQEAVEEENKLTALYAAHIQYRAERPTPRSIKVFVNAVGALKRQWNYSLADLGYYVLQLQENGEAEIEEQLLKGQVPASHFEQYVSDEVADIAASLLFNMPREEAQEVLYRSTIDQSLAQFDSDSLRELSLAGGNSFFVVLRNVIEHIDFNTPNDSYALSCLHVLNESGIYGPDNPITKAVIDRFTRRILDIPVKRWALLDERAIEGLCFGLGVINSLNVSEATLKGLTAENLEVQADKSKIGDNTIREWARNINRVLNCVEDLGHGSAYQDGIDIPVTDQEHLLLACEFLREISDDKRRWRLFRVKEEIKDLPEKIAQFTHQEWASSPLHIDFLASMPTKWDWKKLIDHFQAVFDPGHVDADPKVFADLLHSIWVLRKKHPNEVNKVFQRFAQHGRFLHYASVAKNSNSLPETALSIVTHNCYLLAGQAVSGTIGQSPQGTTLLDGVFSDPEDHSDLVSAIIDAIAVVDRQLFLGKVLEGLSITSGFVRHFLSMAVESGRLSKMVNAGDLVKHWKQFQSIVEEQLFRKILSIVNESGDLLGKIKGEDFSEESLSLYLHLLATNAKTNESFVDWIVEGIRRIPQSSWLDELENSSTLLQLVLEVRGLRSTFTIRKHLYDAINSDAKRLASGNAEATPLGAEFRDILSLIEETERSVLPKTLIDSLQPPSDSTVGTGYFQRYGDIMLHLDAILEKSDFVRSFAMEAIKHRHCSAGAWLAKAIREFPEILSSYADEEIHMLKDRIRECLDGEIGDAFGEAVLDLADLLGVERSKEENEERTSESDDDKAE